MSLKSILLLLISFSASFFISCGTESTQLYTLTTAANGEGTVTPSSGEYEEGEKVTISGTPTENWRFVQWEGDWSSTENTTTITMNSDKNVIGVFERRDYPLNIEIEGNGTLEEKIISQPKTTDYIFETVVGLTPVSEEGWVFYSWGGDLSGFETPSQITIDGDKNVTVTFKQGSYQTYTLSYDSNNNLIEQIIKDSNDSLQSKTTYSYDSNNNLSEQINYNSDGLVQSRTTYSYDSNNKLIESKYYNSNGSLRFTATYSYDSNNNLAEQISYNSDGLVQNRVKYIYDSNNNRIELISYNSDGVVQYRSTSSYDSNNNLIETVGYNSDGSLQSTTTYIYDSNNNVSARITYNPEGLVRFRIIHIYDSNNNLIGYRFTIFSHTQNKSSYYEQLNHRYEFFINGFSEEMYMPNYK